MDPAELFITVAGLPLPEAAARFAASGVPVFPCVPGDKRPLVEHGFHEATTDAGRVASWWRRWPSANIGVPTGQVSGLEVVDVDQKTSGSGFAAFDRARRAGLVPEWLGVVRTPSGGAHFYFQTDLSRVQPSWQAAKAHVDFRGAGGYVIVPPSTVVTEGRRGRYELAGPAQARPAAVNAAALRHFLDPRPEPAFRRAGITRPEDAERLAGWVSALGEGERNRGLFWAACRLAEAGVAPSVTLDALGPAGEQIGLPPREVVTTIRSAYRATSAAPPRASVTQPGQGEAPRRMAWADSQVLS
ncbi:bifunctional DNA primase/polymerase [Microbacterium sp.]|uniref:bifunctional DNA primase/polymerase n=1 Tax=Microbacterium sp. TaxID=51671 RepID=UPI001AD093B8|nr:bifunctional DNA primase/polymerase [Microbacterium sp.]MBN9155701.1 bifunctional DNA primase/polymerase [Microbacterium sp.]MBN9191849.1 bifunctional DNA primase/polymerase [Microbacterium sp.]MBN9608107.1 bifunctional DNA primase/polymerase [Actinomycetota bacterium]